MREYPIILKEGLTKGLRDDNLNPRNTQLLIQCRNMRPTKYGLAAHSDVQVAPVASSGNLITNGGFDDIPGWGAANGWTISGGVATHTPTIPLPLYQDTGITNSTDTVYRITFEVKNYVAGTITPAIQATLGTARSANGLYAEEEIVHDGATAPNLILLFRPSIDFDGAIDNVRITEVTWPFPQIFKGKEVTLAVGSNHIFLINETDWTMTQIATYDAQSMTTEKVITADGPWHFCDMGSTWLLFNGSCVVFRGNLHNVTGLSYPDRYFVHDGISVETGCYFRGRSLMGGFSSSDTNPVWGSLGQNCVLWSNIGGGDVFWPFVTDLATQELKDAYIERNEMGFMPMPWQGKVLCLKPLGKAVMVYGENGVSALVPHAAPVPTFGLVELLNIGIQGRGAVGGDDRNHMFIDTTGDIWYIGADLNPVRKGYQYLFKDKLDETLTIAHDVKQNVFYLCAEDAGYTFSEAGANPRVGEIVNYPTSLIYGQTSSLLDYGLVGGFTDYTSDDTFQVKFDTVDMDVRALKTLQKAEASVTDISDLELATDYKYNGGTFSSSSWLEANDEGWAMPQITALDFRLAVKGTLDTDDARIDRITATWKLSDRRGIRGPYVTR